MNKQALIKLAQVRMAINHVLRQRMTKKATIPYLDNMIKQSEGPASWSEELRRKSDAVRKREEELRNDPLVQAIMREEQRTGLFSHYPPIIQAQKLREDWARHGEPPLYTPHKNTRMISPPLVPKTNITGNKPITSNNVMTPPASNKVMTPSASLFPSIQKQK